ncbi:MAG: hypothetical protein KGL53_10810, partial [Elusimicrobia bacterium]|nr:hypothetical protein [Elusimicrobiota bacterium]
PVRAALGRLDIRVRPMPARGAAQAASFVLGRARAGRRAAYLACGDPLFLDEAGQRLKAACEQESFPLRVCHGVSSLEPLLGLLPAGSLQDGGLFLCVPSAAGALSASVPALVFLLGTDRRRRYALDCIRRKYPPAHVVELLLCSFGDPPGVKRRRVRVDGLARLIRGEMRGATLYIPALDHA